MKKIYLLSFASFALFNVYGQKMNSRSIVEKRSDSRIEKTAKTVNENEEKVIIWESDFSNASDWVVAHDAADCSLDFEIGSVSCQGSYAIADINSTSAANGWAIVDSDFYGGAAGGTEVEDSWLTMALPVDLTAYPNVIVEFETYYRAYNFEKPYLVVGVGDGAGNVTWPTDLNPQSDLTTYTGVYDIFPERAYNEQTSGTENPRKVRINISAVAGGQQEIYIRFNWTGTWGYAWFIDDFKILEQPANDVQSNYAFFAGTNNEGIEYGRTPLDQLDVSYDLGGEVENFGVNAQTNVQVVANYGSFSYTYPVGAMTPAQVSTYGGTETPALAVGAYDGTFTVTSTEEGAMGPDFYNNVSNRSFDVTTDLYSQDGIGVHPAGDQMTSSLGSDSFGEPTDTYLASMFHLKGAVNQISGVEIGLASSTVAGGDLLVFFVDTADFFANGLTPITDLNNAQVMTNYHTVGAADVAAGKTNIAFSQVIELAAGAYFCVVQPINNGSTPIRILDDQTIAQPYYASMINTLDAQGVPTAYSNGNAYAIRLMMGDQMGVEEASNASSFAVYPNPANASTAVSFEVANESNVSLNVTDLSGKVVFTQVLGNVTGTHSVTIDTQSMTSGIYMVNLSIDGAVSTKKLVVKK